MPADYHQEQLQVKRSIWRKTTLAIALALIVLGTIRHRDVQQSLQEQSRSVRANANKMAAQLKNPAELQREIHQLKARTNLIAQLRINVPPTLLLSSVTNCLPTYVNLTNFRSTYETNKQYPSSQSQPRKLKGDHPGDGPLAEEVDAQQLSEEIKRNDAFVAVSGIASDDVAISHYLEALNQTNVFKEVQLVFTDKYAYDEFSIRNFEIRLRVKRPGTALRSLIATDNEDKQRN